jgi:hypothetical protein
MDDSEITRTFDGIMRALDKNAEALIRFEELVQHLTTKDETAKLEVRLIKWIIGTNVTVGAAIIGVLVYLTNQFGFMLQHWKP